MKMPIAALALHFKLEGLGQCNIFPDEEDASSRMLLFCYCLEILKTVDQDVQQKEFKAMQCMSKTILKNLQQRFSMMNTSSSSYDEEKYKTDQGLARQGFHFRDRDRDCLNPSLNIETETETMNLEVSVSRPRPRL